MVSVVCPLEAGAGLVWCLVLGSNDKALVTSQH